MLAQAAGFAILATLSPAALAVMAAFLASASPRRAGLMYVAGAMLMTLVTAVAMLLIIRAYGLELARGREPRFGLRLATGILALAVAAVISRRKPRNRRDPRNARNPREGEPGKGLVSRIIRRPTARMAFLAGLILFAPSATFIAAVQVVATADADIPLTLLGLAMVVVLAAMIPWLPLVAYLIAPDATITRLMMLNSFLRVHGKKLAIAILTICGIALVITGVLGLATGR